MVTILILFAIVISLFYAQSSVKKTKGKENGKDDILDDLP